MEKTISRYLDDIMPGGRPGHMEIVDETLKHEVRVHVVGPRGQVNVIKTGPFHKGSTAGVVFWSEELNAPIIPPRHQTPQADGLPAWVFMRDGCAALGGLEKYENLKWIDDQQQQQRRIGQPLPRYTDVKSSDLYPEWVMARRASFKAGRREVNLKALLDKRARATAAEREALGSLSLDGEDDVGGE